MVFNFYLPWTTIKFSFFFVKIYKSILVFRIVMSDGPLWTSSPYFLYLKFKACSLTLQNQRKFSIQPKIAINQDHRMVFNFYLPCKTIKFSFFFVKIYKSILVFRNVMSTGPLWTSSPYFSYLKYKSCLLTVQNQRKFQCTKDFGYIGKFSFVFILCRF